MTMGDKVEAQGEKAHNDKCAETLKRLYVYLDGELTEDRRRSIKAHLDECSPCVEALEFEAELRRVVADRCRDRVPDQLLERVAHLLEQEQAAHRGSPAKG